MSYCRQLTSMTHSLSGKEGEGARGRYVRTRATAVVPAIVMTAETWQVGNHTTTAREFAPWDNGCSQFPFSLSLIKR